MNSFDENATYTNFATVYDEFMDDWPYEAWAGFVRNLLELYEVSGLDNASIAELGCGTGTVTEYFLKNGYKVEAIDLSQDMLDVAKDKCKQYIGDGSLKLKCLDMRAFKLDKKVDAIISMCDSVNYLAEDGDLNKLFKCVADNLNDGGVFIFDLKSLWLYENAMADYTFSQENEDATYIWENDFDEETRINKYKLTLFIKNSDGTYNKHSEVHIQRAFDEDDIYEAAKNTGLEVVEVFGQEPFEKPQEDDERLFYVLQLQNGD